MPRSLASRRLALAAILLLALGVRLGHWLAVRDAPFVAELAMDSAEYDRWAREIAGGDWLGSEAFFQAPLYPYFLAVVRTVAGHRLDAVYLLQILLAVFGVWALYRAGRSLAPSPHEETVGLAAAFLAAVYGPFVFYDVQLLKESLAVTCTAFLLWALAAAGRRHRRRTWLAVGALLGVLVLLRENALLLAPLLPLAAIVRSPGEPRGSASRLRRFAAALGLTVAGLAVVLSPVALRNAAVGGGFLPTTYQGGVNFWIGNNPEADGTYRPLTAGKQVPAYERSEPVRLAEEALGRELTGAEVSRYWLGRSLAWAAEEPGAFLALQLTKLRLYWRWYEWPDAVDYAWMKRQSPVLGWPLVEFGGVVILACAGLWMERRRLAAWTPALLWVIGWTASTVIFFVFSRYRLPMMPALLPLAAVPVTALVRAVRPPVDRRKTLALAALTLVAWTVPAWTAPGPRMDLMHYNLARLHQEAGRTEAAERHYLAAAELAPGDFLPWLNLGTLAARRGDLATALERFRRAVDLAPASDDARANLGAVHLALGNLDRAREELDRALEINPENPWALRNRAVLARRVGDPETVREMDHRLEAVDSGDPGSHRGN